MRRTIIKRVADKAEAQALTFFLFNEKLRHLDDIKRIDEDIKRLKIKWKVVPPSDNIRSARCRIITHTIP